MDVIKLATSFLRSRKFNLCMRQIYRWVRGMKQGIRSLISKQQ